MSITIAEQDYKVVDLKLDGELLRVRAVRASSSRSQINATGYSLGEETSFCVPDSAANRSIFSLGEFLTRSLIVNPVIQEESQ